jgi:hypothetical protein
MSTLLKSVLLGTVASTSALLSYFSYKYYKYAHFACVLQDPSETPGTWRKAVAFYPSPYVPFKYNMALFEDGMDYVNSGLLFDRIQVDKMITDLKKDKGYVEVDLDRHASRYGLQDLSAMKLLFGRSCAF